MFDMEFFLVWAAFIWVSMSVIKFVLCMCSLRLALASFCYVHKDASPLGAMLMMVVLASLICFFMWPMILREEGAGFFLAYEDQEVVDVFVRGGDNVLRH